MVSVASGLLAAGKLPKGRHFRYPKAGSGTARGCAAQNLQRWIGPRPWRRGVLESGAKAAWLSYPRSSPVRWYDKAVCNAQVGSRKAVRLQ